MYFLQGSMFSQWLMRQWPCNLRVSPIPNGLSPPAQGCEERALHEPKVWSPGFSRLGAPTRFMVPMHDFAIQEATLGVGPAVPPTLSFRSESLWDSPSHHCSAA